MPTGSDDSVLPLEGGFWLGLHRPNHARFFQRVFISVNVLWDRKSLFWADDWILDSGAFTEISKHGEFRHTVYQYANEIRFWARTKTLRAAVSQDYMCEPFILKRTGGTVVQHQHLTIDRYDALTEAVRGAGVYLMPVLQGYQPCDYVSHLRQYGKRLKRCSWVGVGSVCKRNGNPEALVGVLQAIKTRRPDLRLHGFGIKTTALADPRIVRLLYSADSMAWSAAARWQGGDANCRVEARIFRDRIEEMVARHRGEPA